MADWADPKLVSQYSDVLTELRGRDFDTASLFRDEPANPKQGMIRLVRNPIKFQERGASDWEDIILSIAGGGTGAATKTDARTSLGFGTLAAQNSDSVTITGGKITGVSGIGVGDGTITTDKIKDNAVTDDKLAANGLNISRFTLGQLNKTRIDAGTAINYNIWRGSQSAYNTLTDKRDDTIYLIIA